MEYTLFRTDVKSNTFLVIRKKRRDKNPLIVHGIIEIQGENYVNSVEVTSAISKKLDRSGKLNDLVIQARYRYFYEKN